MKKVLFPIALALFAGLVLLATRPDKPFIPRGPATPGTPWFEVQVVKPRSARPLGGLLPDGIFGLPRNVLTFDSSSPGAEVVHAGPRRIELRADGWSLLLELDAEGGITPGTHLVFPIELANKQLSLRGLPAHQTSGDLSTGVRSGSDRLRGEFHIELAVCENAATGKAIDWPQAPLEVQGAFGGIPHGPDELE